jgi:hypothetical protein
LHKKALSIGTGLLGRNNPYGQGREVEAKVERSTFLGLEEKAGIGRNLNGDKSEKI